MSKYLQIYEVALLQILFEAAQEKGLIRKEDHNMCLCHDGAMIPKSAFTEENSIGSFIDFLNKKVLDDTGMDIQFKSKAFDEYGAIEEGLRKEGIDWTADAQEWGEDDDYTGETPVVTPEKEWNEQDFGQYFLKKYSHLFIYNTLCGELAYYNEETKGIY